MSATYTFGEFEIPAHIPQDLVRPIGLSDGPEFLAAPHDYLASLHRTQPRIFYSPSRYSGSAWMVTHHEDAYHVLRKPEVFSTENTSPFPRDKDNYFYLIPLEIDPPGHRKYRAILDPMFSPQAIAKLETDIRARANRLIDAFVDKGECEFTTDFGRPLPVSVFLDLMGLPQEMTPTFVKWAMNLIHSTDREQAKQTMIEVCGYLQGAINEKTKTPDAGAVSAIVHSQPGGEPIDPRDVFGFTFFLFIAGLDTVFATLNNIFLWLAENPERRREIIDNPDNIGPIVEELLRVFSVTYSGRTLTQDYEMQGVQMKKGDKLTCILPACNYDPAVFENPEEVNFHRPRKPMLAFTAGPHSCMGAHLARLEVKVSIVEFLKRIPDFRVRDGAKIDYWPGGVIGPKSLPLVW